MLTKILILLTGMLFADLAQGHHLETYCSSADNTYTYRLQWSGSDPRVEHWTYNGKEYPAPKIEQLEPRIELFKHEDPMTSRVEWVQKLRLVWQFDSYESFILCKSFFGF